MAHVRRGSTSTVSGYSFERLGEEHDLASLNPNPFTDEQEARGSYAQEPYRPVPHSNSLDAKPSRMKPSASWRTTILLQTFSLLWLGPVVALLALNFKAHIIGASAWCPRGRCWVQAHGHTSPESSPQNLAFDRSDHNLLGMLQVASKLLELWFIFITAGLMYLVVMRTAGRLSGIPLRFLALPVEFADPTRVLSFSLWKSPGLSRPKDPRARFWSLVLLAVVLCALCTFMGPAIAVLIIPSLQWVSMPNVELSRFDGFRSTDVPRVGHWAFRDTFCTENDFDDLNFACTRDKWGVTLDAWVANSVASMAESPDGSLIARITQQSDIFFYLNTTKNFNASGLGQALLWVPSRQLIEAFSFDRRIVTNISRGDNATRLAVSDEKYESYARYNQSLRMDLKRNGPVLGTMPNIVTGGGWWTVPVDSERSVVCFSNYALSNPIDPFTNNFTKCIQEGRGWGENVKSVNLLVEGTYTIGGEVISPEVTVNVTSSDRAVFLPDGTVSHNKMQYGDGSSAVFHSECIERRAGDTRSLDVGLECDWDFFFSRDFNQFSPKDVTDYITTIRYRQAFDGAESAVAVDFVTYADITEYSFDPAVASNPTRLVQTPILPKTAKPISLDPAWYLAALSLDYRNAILPSTRTTSQMLLKAMDAERTGLSDAIIDTHIALITAIYMPIMQTLSLVDFAFVNVTSGQGPLLYRSARLQVWAYGFTSRTAYFGATIVVAGAVVVLAQFVLGLIDRRDARSPTQVLIAALAHMPDDESSGAPDDGLNAAGRRFRVVTDHSKPGKLRFEEL